MGEEDATDFAAPLGAISWILKRKLLLGVFIGIFLSPVLDRSTVQVLNRFFPRSANSPFGEMTEQMPGMFVQVQRLEVLNQLVQDRHILDGDSGCPLTLDVVQALNRVPLLFAGEADVINSYNLTQDSGRSPVAFANMLSGMAETLEIEAPVLARRGIPYRCE